MMPNAHSSSRSPDLSRADLVVDANYGGGS